MSKKIDFHLDPDSRMDAKWLKTDLEEALKKNMVPHYWNELLKDNELIVHSHHNSKNSSGSSYGIFLLFLRQFLPMIAFFFLTPYLVLLPQSRVATVVTLQPVIQRVTKN